MKNPSVTKWLHCLEFNPQKYSYVESTNHKTTQASCYLLHCLEYFRT